MAGPPSANTEQHCASCGAVLYEGADWCTMCFTPVRATPEPAPPTARATVADPSPGGAESPANSPMWPCPVCDGRNPIDLDVCATCGTPFASLMRQERTRPTVDRREAFRRSLLYPGLGHRMVGLELDGFARGVLFTMLLIATLMLAFSGVPSGAVRSLFLLYAAATVGVYLMTAFEAARLADGGDLIVSSRALLWATVAILLVSIVMVSLVIGTASKR